ncbi:acyltransferase family protein [Microbacterium excoecariae]|uniref:acyltransferase family protein n=1 Tax=Microbacterium excoecariae TaxID=2715210 RepID=UPI00140DBCE8|nr:acyltransferase family protein [Microbacterium excoecariae]NHI17390.1 acyltransferase [Microbacterium excoecariae]
MPPAAPAPAHAPRLDVQGLRAVAVLAVIADHVFAWPSGGFVGVDVFFVISGFLITGLLLREIDRTGRISFRRFYARRAKRILPAAAIVIFATVVASLVLLGRSEAKSVAIDGVFSALFVGNWRFAAEGVDYFAQGTPPSPLQHFWSLGVEEQFYLVWPWLMLAIVVFATSRAGKSLVSARRATVVAIALLTAASFGWGLYETATNPAVAYFSTFSRAWELGVGALLAFAPALALSPGLRRALAWGGLGLIALSLAVVSGDSPLWPAPLALLPVAGALLVIVAGGGGYRGPAPLTVRPVTYVGDISYSLYLWHFPVAILLVTLLPAGSVAYGVVALAATAILSVASYHLVEDPARRATWFRRRGAIAAPTRAWLPTVASLAVVGLAGAAAFVAVDAVRAPAGPATAAVVETADGEIDCRGAGTSAHPDACADASIETLAPAPADLLDDTGGAYACYSTTDVEMQTCHYGSEDPDATRVALVGDSHAAALLPGLEPQLADREWSLDTYVGRGCILRENADVADDCSRARDDINARLTSGDYALVIATSSRAYSPDVPSQQAMLEAIAGAGTTVVVVADNPLPSEDAIACTTRLGVSPASACATAAAEALDPEHTLQTAAEGAGVPVVDLTDLYCTEEACDGIIGGVLVYRDAAGHTTATWARSIGPYLADAIARAAA